MTSAMGMDDFTRYVSGEDDVDHGAVRRELARQQVQIRRLMRAWDDTSRVLITLARKADDLGKQLMDNWHDDPAIRHGMFFEGVAWLRVNTLLARLAHSMKLTEAATDDDGDEA